MYCCLFIYFWLCACIHFRLCSNLHRLCYKLLSDAYICIAHTKLLMFIVNGEHQFRNFNHFSDEKCCQKTYDKPCHQHMVYARKMYDNVRCAPTPLCSVRNFQAYGNFFFPGMYADYIAIKMVFSSEKYSQRKVENDRK